MSNVKKMLDDARLPGSLSPGGAKIWQSELKNAWNEALKPEAGEPEGKPITADEAKAFAELNPIELSYAARRLLNQIKGQIPGLLQPEGGGGGGGTSGSITPPGARKPVFLNTAGWPAPTNGVTGQPPIKDAEVGFYRLALAISNAVQAGKPLDTLEAVPLGDKQKLIENAIAMAKKSISAPGGVIEGLTADQTAQLRSSAFTVLYHLGKSLSPSGTTANLQNRVHTALIKMVEDETDKWFAKHMSRVLDRKDYLAKLTADQKEDVKEVFEARHPQKFDVGNILDSQGYISWEHVSGQGEGFYKSFIQNLKKQTVNGATFKKVGGDYWSSEFELKFDPPKGQDGRIKGIRIKVREFRDDMFDSVGQKKGFSYGGHSNIGENQENSMEKAMLAGLKANSPQLAILDLCAGLDNLDEDLENLGNIEVLTTFSSSFFWKGKITDEAGNQFDGVTSSEGMESLIALFESLSREENYEQMRARVSDAIWSYSHERNPNVAFPTIQDYREVRWAHLDGDDDGRMDANDVLYQFGLRKAAKELEKEFVLKDNGAPDELNGDALKDAILDLNVATHYNSSTSSNSAVEHKFMANGYFDGAGTTDLLRFESGTNHDGKPAMLVSVNSGLAHTTREALEALTQYMSMVKMCDDGKVTGLSEVDRKLMGLTFAAFRLTNDGKDRTNDQRIWRQLLDVLRLPADLPYGRLASLVDAEHHDYSGNMKIVNDYKASLSPEVLTALAAQDVGRPGGGPPVITNPA